MRGSDERSGELFSCVDLEDRVPTEHPLRVIRRIVNEVPPTADGRRLRSSGRCARFCCRCSTRSARSRRRSQRLFSKRKSPLQSRRCRFVRDSKIEVEPGAATTRTSSFLFLCKNLVPVIPISFRNRFLTFAPAIAGGYGGSYLAPLNLRCLCTWNALLLRSGLTFWSGAGFDFFVVASHHLSQR
jgi:hypothetical protein